MCGEARSSVFFAVEAYRYIAIIQHFPEKIKYARKVSMEQIYTIPINEVFDTLTSEGAPCECPMCRLEGRMEENELDLILGASMMEPDIRIKTNAQGFCRDHYKKMLGMKNRLGLSLMLESHLAEVKKRISPSLISSITGKRAEQFVKEIAKMECSCYICGKMSYHLTRSSANLAVLYATDDAFRKKFVKAPYICLPHARILCESAKKQLSGKDYGAFTAAVMDAVLRYMDSLSEDVSFFCKKFDYRYADEPWGNAKDAPIRAAAYLTGDPKAE